MMDDKNFQKKLSDLVAQIDELPADQKARMENVAEEAKSRQAKMKEMITTLTENLDYLRLSVKYLVFDLEATRRENKYLREMVERQQGNEGLGDTF